MSIRTVSIIAGFAVVGLVIGYFVFAQITVPIVGASVGRFEVVDIIKGNAPASVTRNILLCGGGGAIVGLVLALLLRGKKG
ncbi:MAG: hypothetical protein LBR07_08290 [Puniceicoccales bacterium]|jgi:hypothetical protein|nr:hypothetical protein [Puniceicoccales bacterium]